MSPLAVSDASSDSDSPAASRPGNAIALNAKVKDEGLRPRDAQQFEDGDWASQIFLWLIAFRLMNALIIRTIFQPDEYFQSLEPAWELAFGEDSGAWITWEWRYYLRSSLLPFMFATFYKLSDSLAAVLHLSDSWRAEILIAAPKVLQAFVAAVGDYYTWKLGGLVYGEGEYGAWLTLVMTLANPFHFFVSTRTLSNCSELALNAAALYLWFTSAPEDPPTPSEAHGSTRDRATKEHATEKELNGSDMSMSWISAKLDESAVMVKNFVAGQIRKYDLNRLRLCLILAAIACVLRITNILTWLVLLAFEFVDYDAQWRTVYTSSRFIIQLPRLRDLNEAHLILARESIACGMIVLASSVLLDYTYYNEWTLPAAHFLWFNVAEGISSFYGTSDITWYFVQGFPLLMGAYSYFTYKQIRHHLTYPPATGDDLQEVIKYEFSGIAVIVPFIFSFIAHKELRFVYPLIPILHVLAAGPAAEYLSPVLGAAPLSRRDRQSIKRYAWAFGILFGNILVSLIITQYHQRGPLDVVDYLRHEHEAHYLTQPPPATGIPSADTTMTVGFLMPCHSTPWRSHLVHPSIKAWALGCEPPIGMTAAQRRVYRDEADQFYDAPEKFLKKTLGKPKPAKRSGWITSTSNAGFGVQDGEDKAVAWDGKEGRKIWPEYLVFFAEKEALLAKVLKDTDYVQCWRGWNTWFHDDFRRRGDFVVWCHRDKPLNILEDSDGIMAQKLLRKARKADN